MLMVALENIEYFPQRGESNLSLLTLHGDFVFLF